MFTQSRGAAIEHSFHTLGNNVVLKIIKLLLDNTGSYVDVTGENNRNIAEESVQKFTASHSSSRIQYHL